MSVNQSLYLSVIMAKIMFEDTDLNPKCPCNVIFLHNLERN